MGKTKQTKIIYKPTEKLSLVREQLGLEVYETKEKAIPSLEIAKSKHPKFSKHSDIDLNKWKEYTDIITDSLWLFGGRDKSGVHTGELHGNFIPQIPHQAILRYTKKDEIVLDTFLGSGTTLIECKRLGRHGVGVELIPQMAEKAKELVEQEKNPFSVKTFVLQGDSQKKATAEKLSFLLETEFKQKKVQLIVMHPPYHDIIKFSNNPNDLCNAPSTKDFLERFSEVVTNSYDLLESKRFLVLVIGDKYTDGEWVPLGFMTMQKVIENGYKLKSIVIKNIVGNRAKRNLENFWRRRALTGGFYIFKHEYIMFFQKKK